jgi:hypothetical protein
MNIKIQSMTDVITNSSTSVFCVYEPQNIDTIKRLVNSILAISGDYTFDDLFDIKFKYDYEDISYFLYIEKLIPYKEQYDFIKSLSEEEFNKIVEEAGEYEGCDFCTEDFYGGIEVTVKPGIDSLKVEKAALLISQIDSIFDLDYSCD